MSLLSEYFLNLSIPARSILYDCILANNGDEAQNNQEILLSKVFFDQSRRYLLGNQESNYKWENLKKTKTTDPLLFEIALTPYAYSQIMEIRNLYNHKKHHLGEVFMMALEDKIYEMEENPLQFNVKRNGFRHALLEIFPYQIFYDTENNPTTIVSVIHNSKDPSFWE